jgi:hypothetical protein
MRHPLISLVVIATVLERVDCVLWLEIRYTCSAKFPLVHGGSASSYNSITKWVTRLGATGSVVNKKSPGRSRTSNEDQERINIMRFYVQ